MKTNNRAVELAYELEGLKIKSNFEPKWSSLARIIDFLPEPERSNNLRQLYEEMKCGIVPNISFKKLNDLLGTALIMRLRKDRKP